MFSCTKINCFIKDFSRIEMLKSADAKLSKDCNSDYEKLIPRLTG